MKELARSDIYSDAVKGLRQLARVARRRVGAFARRVGFVTRIDLDYLRAELAAEQHGHRIERLERLASVEAVSCWIAQAHLESRPLVSIVMPTRDRPDHLRRAIDSVLASRYDHWELLIADDGAGTARVIVDGFRDRRLRWVHAPGRGPGPARNAALKLARGTIIAYLDDDNTMDAAWLRAVVWGFEHHPQAEILYGAFMVQDTLRLDGRSSGALPQIFLHPWDREALMRGNLADIGAVAHRAGLPEAFFDEEVQSMEDWDLVVRLTAERDPLVLPVIAFYYHTDTPDRKTRPIRTADRETIVSRASASAAGARVLQERSG